MQGKNAGGKCRGRVEGQGMRTRATCDDVVGVGESNASVAAGRLCEGSRDVEEGRRVRGVGVWESATLA